MPKRYGYDVDKEWQADTSGYNEFALRSAVAMAGNKSMIFGIARVTRLSEATITKRLRNGQWTRADMKHMIDAFNLNAEQVMEIFFNGKPNAYELEQGTKHVRMANNGRNPKTMSDMLKEIKEMKEGDDIEEKG